MSKQAEESGENKSIPGLIELSPNKPSDIKKIAKNKENKKESVKQRSIEPAGSAYVITKVQAQKAKNRFNIYINDAYAFAVDDSILVKYRLMKGKELDKPTIEELKIKGEMSKAYQAALHYLNYKMRTEKEIREYLRKKDYEQIDLVIEKLKNHRLINEKEYARSFVRTNYQLKNEGPKKIERALSAKGLTKEEIYYGLEEYSMEQQQENALNLIEKTLKRQRNKSNREIKQKIREELMKKGFESEVISYALEESSLEQPEDEEYEALEKQGEKAWKRYARKYDQYEVKKKTKAFLYSKGYPFDLIEQFLQEKEGDS